MSKSKKYILMLVSLVMVSVVSSVASTGSWFWLSEEEIPESIRK